jgi:hypothetical protein
MNTELKTIVEKLNALVKTTETEASNGKSLYELKKIANQTGIVTVEVQGYSYLFHFKELILENENGWVSPQMMEVPKDLITEETYTKFISLYVSGYVEKLSKLIN